MDIVMGHLKVMSIMYMVVQCCFDAMQCYFYGHVL